MEEHQEEEEVVVVERKENLKQFKVGCLPTLIYIPSFINDSEQTHLLQCIYQSPISKWKSLKNRRLQNWGGVVHEKGLLPQNLPPWLTKITKRICEETGLFPSPINHVLINEYLPDQGIMPHQDGPAYFPVVAILSLGSSAVMNFTPHSRLRESTITERSTPEDANCDNITTDNSKEKTCSSDYHPSSVLLMPCSLLIFKDEAYSDYLHGIEDTNVHQLDKAVNIVDALKHHRKDSSSLSSDDKEEAEFTEQIKSIERTATRISLTCRLVLKLCEFTDYLHGIEDTNVHQLDKAVNILDALKHRRKDSSSLSSDNKEEAEFTEQIKSIGRTGTRISLTCRLVLKVHRNLFKF